MRPEDIDNWVASLPDRPFQWGVWDCLNLGSAWAVRCGGKAFAEVLQGEYTDPAGAYVLCRREGGYAAWLQRQLPDWVRHDYAPVTTGALVLWRHPRNLTPLPLLSIGRDAHVVYGFTRQHGIHLLPARYAETVFRREDIACHQH